MEAIAKPIPPVRDVAALQEVVVTGERCVWTR
jgi:hypothetical protein